jgi:hypothetical protein
MHLLVELAIALRARPLRIREKQVLRTIESSQTRPSPPRKPEKNRIARK